MRSIAWAFFPGMNISDKLSLPPETDLHCYIAIETGTITLTVSGRGSADFLALGSPMSRKRVYVRDHGKPNSLRTYRIRDDTYVGLGKVGLLPTK